MKKLLLKVLEAITIVASIFVLGIVFPLLVSTFITIFTDVTMTECIVTIPFWVVTFTGWLIAGSYILDYDLM
jgi:hypothetical protein